MAFQVFRKTRKANRVHLKDGSRRDDVADGAVDSWEFSEVVKRGWMKKDKVCRRHFAYWGETGLDGS